MAKRWWDHDGLDLEGMRTAYQAVEHMEMEEEMERMETETNNELGGMIL